MKTTLKSFVTGFVATLVFHQGIIGILYAAGAIPFAPFNMNPTEPLGVPSVISLAFFGGLWGILVWKLVAKDAGKKHWIKSIIFGAIGPTAVAFLVVFPMKGREVTMAMIPVGLILNGAWGFGNSLFMKLMGKN